MKGDAVDTVLARVANSGPVPVADIGLGSQGAHGRRDGVTVGSVTRGGPANVAGVHPHDLIQRVDGEPVQSMSDVVALVSTRGPGQTLTLTLRGRRAQTVTVVLGSRTAPASTHD